MDMGQKIYNLRTQKGMTLEELGNLVGVGKSTVRKWENGMIANMKRDKILKVSEALGTSPAYLMGWEEPESSPDNPLTKRDERDIKNDLDSIMGKLTNQENGPAAYNGEALDPEAAELFREELEIALKRLKIINKEKYNPYKNKK